MAKQYITSIGIIGAGLMGRGIAQVSISSGYNTLLIDVDDSVLEDAKTEIHTRLDHEVEKERMTLDQIADAKALLDLSNDLQDGIGHVDLFIECVPENIALKQNILTDIHTKKECIIASNTSSISIDKLASKTDRPDLIIGMHFFNPAPVMKLVEIIIGDKTSQQVINTITHLAKEFGKDPIHVQDFPGFASSRLGVALGLEAIRMVEQGVASVEDIDKAMTLGYRHPMGPLELTDYIGLDTRLKIAEYLQSTGISPSFEIPNLLREMVNEGKLGRKSGRGFYEWKEGKKL